LNKAVLPIGHATAAISAGFRSARFSESGALLGGNAALLGTNPKFRIVHGLD
jgi:hypothetical protein